MKELVLIPKHIYEILSNSNQKSNNASGNTLPKEGEEWQTRILPPPLQNNIRLNEVKIPEKKTTSSNPFIYELLALKIKTGEISHARTLLKYFENSGVVSWNSQGDLYAPLNNYNIIDVIHDFIYKTHIYDTKKIDDYRYFISVTNIPPWLIKNNLLMNKIKSESASLSSLSATPSTPSTRKKKGSGLIKIVKDKRNKWISY